MIYIPDDFDEDRTYGGRENRRPIGSVWVFFVIISMVFTSSLVCLRVYGLSLDSRYDSLSAEASSLQRSLADLDKRVLSMGSPSSVYNYACEQLGMNEVAVAGVIKVRLNSEGELASVKDLTEPWSGSLPSSGTAPSFAE